MSACRRRPCVWLGSKLARHASTAEKHLIVAQAAEENAPETATTVERQALKEQSLNARKDYDQARQVQTTYHENLQGVSDAIHPFALVDNSPNDAEKIAEGLETRAKAIEQLAGEQEISDHKDVMKKFRNQISQSLDACQPYPESTPVQRHVAGQ